MEITTEYISAACNCTYNCVAVGERVVLYGTNKALAIYDLEEEKVTGNYYGHKGRVNCVRFAKGEVGLKVEDYAISCCAGGTLIVWNKKEDGTDNEGFRYREITRRADDRCNTVCDAILKGGRIIGGCVSSESKVFLYSVDLGCREMGLDEVQEIRLDQALANELVFHAIESGIVLALGMDNGSVALYDLKEDQKFVLTLTLLKHEDWVRCIDFVTLENGDTLMASGGQDSFIAVWKFTKFKSESNFEFQVHQYNEYSVVFDSMIIGHEGWVNSLHWNGGELLSCSSDQSIIIWDNAGEIWMEKSRLGVLGGMIPGGCCAKYSGGRVVCSGFHGAIQIWNWEDWVLKPSVTGHFRPISDMDYDSRGNFIVTSSEDQTTRVHARWGNQRWHEISRPQIHGHDLFACRILGDYIISGAEEKILRAFQPTEVFYKNLEDASDVYVPRKDAAKAAFLPALGLSNQTEVNQTNLPCLDQSVEVRLDEDFIRSQSLWLEVCKLYGHVYEIACIATSPTDPLIASASQATQPKFSSIILWCAKRWKNLGEFPQHKLNVTGMEFSPDGTRLLSVSRDRTWAVWKVVRPNPQDAKDFKLEVLDTSGFHTRALWVGTWSPDGAFFVTGARDKKLILWRRTTDTKMTSSDERYEQCIMESFSASVSAAAVNSDHIVAVGLETGEMELFKYNFESPDKRLTSLVKLDKSMAHHDTVKRLRFNPVKMAELASAGADNILKVYELRNFT